MTETIYNALYREVFAEKLLFSCKLTWNHFILESQSTKPIFNTHHADLSSFLLPERKKEKRKKNLFRSRRAHTIG
jgi:hypothetical protein